MSDIDPVIAKAKAERRRFRRVRVDLAGRLFVPQDSREGQCKVADLSPGGASILCDLPLGAGTQIVLYVDGFGRLEGQVARVGEGEYGIRFHCSALKRDRIAEQLILLMNKEFIDETQLRRHDRTPTKGIARFTRADGQFVACEVLDLSVSGVSLKTDVRPPIGEFVLIGQMAGRVARHHEQGIGIEFVGGGPASAKIESLQAKIAKAR
ncbi:MAG TPA: PilZ domain-containing protein [Rhizomicrobium sp.]|nr:PilZ domain-containing protein [Rhizomicrobium sp.]